ncbi:MAG: uracil-xanthine permease family protein [Spirochaetia bacterium]
MRSWSLAIQHVFAMFGATVLVPLIVGMPISIALLTAGIGTLLFHSVTAGMVPAFLGSSFAFIPVMFIGLKDYGIGEVKAGIIMAGVVYLLFAWVAKQIGSNKLKEYFPPIIIGPVIMSIGLKLVPTALSMAGYSTQSLDYKAMFLAAITVATMIVISFLQHSFFRLVPILFAIFVGYVVGIFMGMVNLSTLAEAQWIGLSSQSMATLKTLPVFSWNVILLVAPVTLVTVMEHLGDMKNNGAVCGKDFFEKPGLSRTLLGDGLATIAAGCLGGPANTTYSENTAVLAITKNYDASILRRAAVLSILIAFSGKIIALLQSLPVPVMGGISLMLFSLITIVGLRVLFDAQIDFHNFRNVVIPSLVLVIGTFVEGIPVTQKITISGAFLAILVGLVLNLCLPKKMVS